MKGKFRITLLFFVSLLFTACEKRPFAHIELRGRIVTRYTLLPQQAQIQVGLGAGAPGSSGTKLFAQSHTYGDGTFYIRSKARWDGDGYQLQIIPDSSSKYSTIKRSITARKNEQTNFGNIGL